MNSRDALEKVLIRYQPWNEQEETDRAVMLCLLREQPDIFLRQNQSAHFSASSWIVDAKREQTLMAYHKLYDAWAWTGGHADGEADLLAVRFGKHRKKREFMRARSVQRFFRWKFLRSLAMKSAGNT